LGDFSQTHLVTLQQGDQIGQFPQIGRLLTLGGFPKITEAAPILGLLLSHIKFNLIKTDGARHRVIFFTKSSGHPVTLEV
jgi:hypothetical protein